MIGCGFRSAVAALHEMWHNLIDPEQVAIESGVLHLPDTKPDMTVIVIMSAVRTEYAEIIRDTTHLVMAKQIEDIYGPSVMKVKFINDEESDSRSTLIKLRKM